MDDLGRGEQASVAGLVPDEHGLFFVYHFDSAGYATSDAANAAWTWRSYHLADLRARRELTESDLPDPVRDAFLSSGHDCHIDFEASWLYGDLPDLRHDYSSESHGLGHFRFAFDDKTLIGARKQPLRSVDAVKRMIDGRTRPFRSPAELIEAVTSQSFAGMSAELQTLADQLDGVEDRIVCDAWHSERQALVDLRRKLVVIHRQMASLTSLFRHLDHAHRHDLPEPVSDMAARLSHQAFELHHDGEQSQARARLLQDELMAKLTAQSNRLLYILSVMTAVLLPMSIITGLFGMNVGGLPFISDRAGFWIVTIMSLGVAVTTLYFVRRLGDGM